MAVTKSQYKALRQLHLYNKWRRGAHIPQPEPAEVGKAIDEAIRLLRRPPGETRIFVVEHCDYEGCRVITATLSIVRAHLAARAERIKLEAPQYPGDKRQVAELKQKKHYQPGVLFLWGFYHDWLIIREFVE